RSPGESAGPVAEMERERSVEDEEPVRVLAMNVELRSPLPGPVVELRDRELVGVHEQGCAALRRPIGDVLTLCTTGPANEDEARITRRVLGRGPLVESTPRATDVVAVSRARGVEDEE